ncbi:MAG TPA: MarR family winged helix-turn-helix transcriptional regulator [Iamia sp.]|jgi:MarR family transcriptional regulator for hemolysin|nr:MarR family winged helix-turn-helix transcriptional regulator [Iamia sp.]
MDTTPDEEPIGLLLTRTAKTVNRAFDEALAEVGGSLPQWLVLTSLAGEPHRTQRSIAAAVGVEGPTLTHHLNKMETAGLVTRARDPENRRAHQVALTEGGWDEFRSLLGAVQGFDHTLRADLGETDLATLRTLLRRLIANATSETSAGTTDKENPS